MKKKRMDRMVLSLLALALIAGGMGQVQAFTGTSIPGLYNTGVSNGTGSLPPAGTLLGNGTEPDPNYSLVSTPLGLGGPPTLVRTSTGGFPIPPWLGDSTLSTWIGPDWGTTYGPSGELFGPVGDYDYQTSFTIDSSLNYNTASIISGKFGWSADNTPVKIVLNGVTKASGTTDYTQFQDGYATFSITSGFKPGLNTLDFVVHNDTYGGPSSGNPAPNPTGLRVDLQSNIFTTNQIPIPEPSTLCLLGLGLLWTSGPIWLARRRKLTL